MIDINTLPEDERVLEQARRNVADAFNAQRPLGDPDWSTLIKAAEDILKLAGAR